MQCLQSPQLVSRAANFRRHLPDQWQLRSAATSTARQSHPGAAIWSGSTVEEDNPASFVDASNRFDRYRLGAPWPSLVLLNPTDCVRRDFGQLCDFPHSEL